MSMVERVARAIYDKACERVPTLNAFGFDVGDLSWEGASERDKQSAIEEARAAIEVMREPTDAMIEAMDEHAGTIAPQYAYEAAIEAALLEQEP